MWIENIHTGYHWIENKFNPSIYFGIKLFTRTSLNHCVSGSCFGHQDITSSTMKMHFTPNSWAGDILQPLKPLSVFALCRHTAAAQAGLWWQKKNPINIGFVHQNTWAESSSNTTTPLYSFRLKRGWTLEEKNVILLRFIYQSAWYISLIHIKKLIILVWTPV